MNHSRNIKAGIGNVLNLFSDRKYCITENGFAEDKRALAGDSRQVCSDTEKQIAAAQQVYKLARGN